MSNLIQKLIRSGECVLYHDYRSGCARDWSGNGNSGVLTATQWTNSGIRFPASTSLITVTDSPELQTTEGTYIVFSESGFFEQYTGQRIISKRDAGGTQAEFYVSNATTLGFYTGSTAGLITSILGKKYVAVNWNNGEKPEGFTDGVSVGLYNAVTAITVDNAPIYIGNIWGGSSQLRNNLSVAAYVNRKLTATEHAQAYSELS